MGIQRSLVGSIAFATLFVGSLTFGRPARAAEPDLMLEKVVALEKKATADATAKSNEALMGDAKAAADLYRESEGKDPYRDRLLAIVGAITKVRQDDVCRTALTVLGEIGDLRGAKYLRGYLRPLDDAKIPVAVETAVVVAKQLPDDSLVEPLLAIVDTSKNFTLAGKAIEALGSFAAVKSKREKILTELVKTVQKSQPGAKGKYGGGGGGDGTSGGTAMDGSATGGPSADGSAAGEGSPGFSGQGQSARWPALSGPLPEALNRLTGTICGSAEEWFSTYKEHKSKLSVLFVADAANKGGTK